MKDIFVLFIFFLFLIGNVLGSVSNQDTLILPKGYILEENSDLEGDLDNDGIAEKIRVCRTNFVEGGWIERELRIYKKEDGNWQLWYKSNKPVSSLYEDINCEEDPFYSIEIEKGCIVLTEFSGGRIKAVEIRRFRYQNDNWELIGLTIESFTPCQFSETLDYNLSTGRIAYTNSNESCEEEV